MEESTPYELIGKYLVGACNDQEKNKVIAWRNDSPGNEKEFQLLLATWHTESSSERRLDVRGEEILEEILSKNPSISVMFPRYYQVAAAVVAVFLIGILSMFFLDKEDTGMITYRADKPGDLLELADGSEVWLSQNSEIIYNENFKVDRTLELVGEAYFKVKSDPKYPFKINALGTQTVVLGTAFNLKAIKEQEDILLLVDEGKVSFSKDGNSEILIKGQSAKITKQNSTIEVGQIENENHLFWQTGVLTFEDIHLTEVVTDLSKYFGVDVELGKDAPDIIYSGRFENKNLQEILDIISLTVNLEVELVNNKYIIRSE